jgi:hypothetical protein
MNIYKQQKFTFKLTVVFSFLLIDVDHTYFKPYVKNKYTQVHFAIFIGKKRAENRLWRKVNFCGKKKVYHWVNLGTARARPAS